MERRQFLAALTGAAGVGLAGCAGALPGRPDALSRERRESNAEETNLVYADDDGTRTLSVALDYGYWDPAEQIGLRASVWHREETTLDSLRLTLRAPAAGVHPITQVYLQTPFPGPGPTLEFETERDGRTVVFDVPDLGIYGEGTYTLEFALDPASMPETLPVAVGTEYHLSEPGVLGTAYQASDHVVVEIPKSA